MNAESELPRPNVRLEIVLTIGRSIKVRLDCLDPTNTVLSSAELASLDARQVEASRLLQSDSVLTKILRDSLATALPHAVEQHLGLVAEAIPLFAYSEPGGAFTESWTEYVQTVLIDYGSAVQIEVVGTAPSEEIRSTARLRPKLPLRCTSIGIDATITLDAVIERASFLRDPAVRDFGLKCDTERYAAWRGEEPLPSAHVWVLSEETFRTILENPAVMPAANQDPDFVIVAGMDEVGPEGLARFLGRDIAVARVPLAQAGDAVDAVGAILLSIVHDEPLQTAIRKAPRQMQREMATAGDAPDPEMDFPPRQPRLFATPAALHRFRLSAVLPEISHAADALFPVNGLVAADGLRKRLLEAAVTPELVDKFTRIVLSADPERQAQEAAQGVTLEFTRESRGLVPLCRLLAANEALRHRLGVLATDAGDLLSKHPELAEALERVQERRVEATLLRREGSDLVPINPSAPLRSGVSLRLRAFLGRQRENSLLVDAAPAIDPLLPALPAERLVELDFVLVGKDFVVESPPSRRVALPRFGGSTPVEWDLIAPTVDQAHAPKSEALVELAISNGFVAQSLAEMRLNVYHGNQLLQSFRIAAVLDHGAAIKAQRYVIMECDFSQTSRFARVDRLPRRDLSLVLNLTTSSATHTLMIRDEKHQEPLPVQWAQNQMQTFTDATRAAIFSAIAGKGPTPMDQFPFDPASLKVRESANPAYDDAVRYLADAGWEIFTRLFEQNPLCAELIANIRNGSGKTIQTVRMEDNYAFPWAVIYDHKLPAGDRSRLPVCRGTTSAGQPCGCTHSTPGYCIRGFWGLRHSIEQLCHSQKDAVEVIELPRSTPVVTVVRAFDDGFVQSYFAHLNADKNVSFREHTPTEDFLKDWAEPNIRTNLLVLIGHMEEISRGGIPSNRFVLQPNVCYLDHGLVASQQMAEKWAAARPLVLLLACGGEATRVEIGVGLATALFRLGAAGVVGAECGVYTSMAARIARDLQRKLAARLRPGEAGLGMGEAMRETLFELVAEGCPGALAFTYLGSADLRLSA